METVYEFGYFCLREREALPNKNFVGMFRPVAVNMEPVWYENDQDLD